jgi:hypothetical protein
MLAITTTDGQVIIAEAGNITGVAKGALRYTAYANNAKISGYPEGSFMYIPWGELEVNGTIVTPENISELMDDIVGKQGGRVASVNDQIGDVVLTLDDVAKAGAYTTLPLAIGEATTDDEAATLKQVKEQAAEVKEYTDGKLDQYPVSFVEIDNDFETKHLRMIMTNRSLLTGASVRNAEHFPSASAVSDGVQSKENFQQVQANTAALEALEEIIPDSTNTDNQLVNNDQLNNALAGISQGFFKYQDAETYIVQEKAQLPVQLPDGSDIPDGSTALLMNSAKTAVYKTTYLSHEWGSGVDQNAEPGFLWTEGSTGNGYYFMPGQDWNQMDVKALASAISNDSTVSGASVKDALNWIAGNLSDKLDKQTAVTITSQAYAKAANGTQVMSNIYTSATPNSIIMRDSSGRASVANPSVATDVATKSYVDGRLTDDMKAYFTFDSSSSYISGCSNLPAYRFLSLVLNSSASTETLGFADISKLKRGYIVTLFIANGTDNTKTMTLPSTSNFINFFGKPAVILAGREKILVYVGCWNDGSYYVKVEQ